MEAMPPPPHAKRLLRQFFSFGVVGIIATLTNAVIYHFIMLSEQFSSIVSNFYAFCIAFIVSLCGQFYWTFDEERRRLDNTRRALFRFFQVSLIGLVINSALAFFIVDYLFFPHQYYIAVMVIFTPIILFSLNKLWVFRP